MVASISKNNFRSLHAFYSLNGTEITSGNNEKLLGVFTDKKLSFEVHIKSLFRKAWKKLSALTKISSYLTLDQKLLLDKSVTES